MSARGDPRGYYRVLGLSRTASAEEIRNAFRERAMASHPDSAGEAADGETFRLIREAYEVLRDPRRRMAYDATGLAGGAAFAGAESARSHAADRGTPTYPASQGRDNASTGARDRDPKTAAEAFAAAPEDLRDFVEASARSSAAGKGDRRHKAEAPRAGAAAARLRAERLFPVLAAGLAVLLIVAVGWLWSAQRQVADREILLTDLYERLARLGEEHADLRTRYRSLAFLELERAGRLGGNPFWATGPVEADWGRAAYLHEIAFSPGSVDLGGGQQQALARALVEIAQRIERLPAEADWLIVLEAQAPRAAVGDLVAVEAWEPALLRLATVLDHILAQGLPSERFAIRFNAGFAAVEPQPPLPGSIGAAGRGQALERVLVTLLCCAE